MPSTAPVGGALPGRTHRGLVAFLAALVVLAVVVPVGADASTRDVPAINWTACGPRLECASVAVPLDWRHPGGNT